MCELLHPHRSAACAAKLVALQRESYAVEAALIGSDAIPPLQDTAATLVAAGCRRETKGDRLCCPAPRDRVWRRPSTKMEATTLGPGPPAAAPSRRTALNHR